MMDESFTLECFRAAWEYMKAPVDICKGAANWGISPLQRIIDAQTSWADFYLIPGDDYSYVTPWRPERDLYPPSVSKDVWEQVRGRAPLASRLVPRLQTSFATPTYGRTWVKTLKEDH